MAILIAIFLTQYQVPMIIFHRWNSHQEHRCVSLANKRRAKGNTIEHG